MILVVATLRQQVLIIGSSRASHGIDPDHVQLEKLASSRFNAAFDGANIVEINSVIKYLAGFSSTPRTAILGLDFMSFADCGPKTDSNRVARMIEGLPTGEVGPPAQLARVLSSLDTIRASFRTLENDRAIAFHDKNGRRLERVFEDRIRERGGYAANFQKLESDFFRLYLVEQADCYYFSNDENKALESFRDLVRIAYVNGTDLRMFVSPIHARQLEVIRLSGLWKQYETWLKKIVAISESEARAISMRSFQIIDFSTFGGLSSETVPEIHDETRTMTWYWESSHYKMRIVNLVVASIFSD